MELTDEQKQIQYYKNNPTARFSGLTTQSKKLNQDLSEAGTVTKAVKIIENFLKGITKTLRNQSGEPRTITNQMNKFGFRNITNFTRMQNVLTGVFATLPGLDKTKFEVSKKMKKRSKGHL